MILRNSATLFATPKERVTAKGEAYTRLEAYTRTADLKVLVDYASQSGQDWVKVLPRVYEKEGTNRISMEISFFKGKPKSK
jgi:hypothetical protein